MVFGDFDQTQYHNPCEREKKKHQSHRKPCHPSATYEEKEMVLLFLVSRVGNI